jgi:hypothetical protein
MGEYRNNHLINILAWGITALIVVITLVLFTVPLWQAGAS